MELWDTITDEITTVEHPPGFENSRFFRPVIATFDDNSIILAGSRVHEEGLMTVVEFIKIGHFQFSNSIFFLAINQYNYFENGFCNRISN